MKFYFMFQWTNTVIPVYRELVYSEYPVLVNAFCRTDPITINRNDYILYLKDIYAINKRFIAFILGSGTIDRQKIDQTPVDRITNWPNRQLT
jgi:hypothetical protein